ncbi:hypothetical protein EXIGLDRAFT_361454 [Exidia glandulosa HHB12029]|uniref:Uncharacterized protein n=1 Tax=Exidia glandulosa HHB12029 TaxID=1314781 RepID=A0A165L8J0_EXIGL|nr:hypothetical protein EXIGLDRAFT_361454 [Exidia glandulosa HHB12029]
MPAQRRHRTTRADDDIRAERPSRHVEERPTPKLARLHPRPGGFAPFCAAKRVVFSGNEDLNLLPYGIKFLELLVVLQETGSFTSDEKKLFTRLSRVIHARSEQLPEDGRQGCDFQGREYIVTGRSKWTSPSSLTIERREYEDNVGVQIWFSFIPGFYFYHNPEGDYFGHYETVLETGEVQGRGIKLDTHQVRLYEYPPDLYASQSGSQAARF